MKNMQFRQRRMVHLYFILAVCLFFAFSFGTAYAKSKRNVKVAFFPMSGYHDIKEDGSYSGMDVEYLNSLCKYAGWEIEYVACDSWDAALQLLLQHQVDLVGSAQYSAERAASYQYADLSSGYTFGIIAAGGDSELAYEDFEAMKEITFGMVKTYVRKKEFLQYMADNGINAPKIREYHSTAELYQALETGQIDAMVHTFMEVQEGQRLIGRFAPRPYYYITYRGNDEVMRELNYAIADLKMNEPELETRLMNRFYQSKLDKSIVFSTEEKKYIADAGPLVVGYFDSYYPFIYEEDGECKGLTREILEGAAALTGLSLQWKRVATPEEASEALAGGDIDIMSYCVHKESEMGEKQLKKLDEYTQVPLVLVMEKTREPNSIGTLAVVPYLEEKAVNVVNPEKTDLLFLDSQADCLEAIRQKKADAALCDGYLAEYQLSSEMQYYNLEIKQALNQEHGVSLSVRSEDTQLAGILNKAVLTIDSRTVLDYMLERNVYSMSSVSQFVQDNSGIIITILLLLLMGVIFVAVHIYRDTRKIQKLMYKDVDIDIWNLNHLIYAGGKILKSERRQYEYVVAYLNITQFQRYKVVYGWNKAQDLLTSIADVLLKCIDEKREICAKADGDHFVLMLSSENGEITERLKNIGSLIEAYIFRVTESLIELQMGVYFIPEDNIDMRGAIACANQAVDFLRSSGGEKIKIFDEQLEKNLKERHENQKLLDSVSVEENFATFYQAKVDIRTEKIVGAEALVRFLDPTANKAVRSPGFFVPYYEQTGKVVEIDFFVFKCVCRMLRRRLDQGEPVVTISCNFSRIHFTKPDFVKRLTDVLEENRVPIDLIEVEVTETLVMEEFQQKIAEQTMNELHAMGIRLSIDDFGSGYSSLGVIEKIPASVIKLDRSFLLNQEDRQRQVKIMKRIVDLAKDLEAQIVCEGVETDADVELMQEIGANVAQGYRYAKPVPEDDFEKRLSENAAAG